MNLTTVASHWSSSFILFADHGKDDEELSLFALLLRFYILIPPRQQNAIVMIVIFIIINTSIKTAMLGDGNRSPFMHRL